MIQEKNPLISVIVPLYNKEPWVEQCIRSILCQTYQNIEILIVNDGSTDDSRSVVASIEDSRIRLIDKTNGGMSSARNRGIEESRGNYIALIDADDEWEYQHLEMLLKGFYELDNVVLVCSDFKETIDGKKANGMKRKLPFIFLQDGSVHYIVIGDYIETLRDGYFLLSGSSVLIRKDIIDDNRLLFYQESEPSEDINYWLRLNKVGNFVFCDYAGLFYHRVDHNSIMNKKTKEAKLVPPFFYNINTEEYSEKDQNTIKGFLTREYYKKAYQNRGYTFRRKELSNYIGGGIEIANKSVLVYLAIRYCPQFIFSLYKSYKKEKL